jgi:hypothetical protein
VRTDLRLALRIHQPLRQRVMARTQKLLFVIERPDSSAVTALIGLKRKFLIELVGTALLCDQRKGGRLPASFSSRVSRIRWLVTLIRIREYQVIESNQKHKNNAKR